MRPIHLCSFGLMLALTAGLVADPPETKEPAKDKAVSPPLADITFADGTNMRVQVVAEKIDLETKYGKLAIPMSDIVRIDFAFRISEELGKRIESAIGKLGSTTFEERDKAMRELREIGLSAYPSLLEASKGGDAEVKMRASTLLGEIRERVPEERLKFPQSDRIQTAEFTIFGKIVSPGLRAKAKYFGEADVKITDLRSLSWGFAANEGRVTIDAAKHGSAHDQWLETSISVEKGQKLTVTATGQVDIWPQGPGQYMTTPKGYSNMPQAPAKFASGCLVGRIGESGSQFLLGEKYDGSAPASGKLYLHIVPSLWNNASTGTYDVKISTGDR
jgi:hypothetical protein